jgi:predicted DNA-binding transcriptional regulator AlpA
VSEDTDRWLTTEEVAEREGVSKRTVEDWRYKRTGPPWTKLVGGVRYRQSAVADWERQQERKAS